MYRYVVTKEWYNEEEVIESDVPLSIQEIRSRIDEGRTFCDEVSVEQLENDEDELMER